MPRCGVCRLDAVIKRTGRQRLAVRFPSICPQNADPRSRAPSQRRTPCIRRANRALTRPLQSKRGAIWRPSSFGMGISPLANIFARGDREQAPIALARKMRTRVRAHTSQRRDTVHTARKPGAHAPTPKQKGCQMAPLPFGMGISPLANIFARGDCE